MIKNIDNPFEEEEIAHKQHQEEEKEGRGNVVEENTRNEEANPPQIFSDDQKESKQKGKSNISEEKK